MTSPGSGNGEDNAYIGLWLIGLALVVAGLPFVAAAAMPWRLGRRIVLTLAVGVAGLVGIVGVVVLVQSLVTIPTQGYGDRPVMRNHLIGLVALVGAIVLVLGPHLSPPPSGRR